MRTNLSPWSRGILGPDNLERIRLNLTDAMLTVLGTGPRGSWTVRIHRAGRPPFEAYHVGSERLWSVIVEGCAAAGVPLMDDSDWAELQAQIGALA